MKQLQYLNNITILTVFLFLSAAGIAQNDSRPFIDSTKYKVVKVNPRSTNNAIHTWDTAHAVYYNPNLKNNRLLLWLAGTNGTPLNVPIELFNTALSQGYRVIALSYITVPAVAMICKAEILETNIDCAAMFRRKRIYGDNDFSLIADEPQDAIIPRFINLLQWLVKNDPSGNWHTYLNGLKPNWEKIAIAGQSQGGGMSEFIGMHENVSRIISFSGGWDYSNSKEKQIATWYYGKATTPLYNWYATYHVNELATYELKEIGKALKIPAANLFALDKPLYDSNSTKDNPNPFHGEGIRNAAYKPIWIKMLGDGTH
jgi:hypothetical protein